MTSRSGTLSFGYGRNETRHCSRSINGKPFALIRSPRKSRTRLITLTFARSEMWRVLLRVNCGEVAVSTIPAIILGWRKRMSEVSGRLKQPWQAADERLKKEMLETIYDLSQ